MTASHLIKRVRRRLDQVPVDVESVDTDTSVLGSISTTFSDGDLIERINRGMRRIVGKVKAQHVPVCIEEKDTTDGTTSITDIEATAVRLLPRRVFGSDDGGSSWTRAFERGEDHQTELNTRDITQATADYPVYVHQDGNFQIFPETLDVRAFVVEPPTGATAVGDTLDLDERFEEPLIYYVVSSCYQTMEMKGLSKFFNQRFRQSLRPYRLHIRYKTANPSEDEEVDTE